MFTSDVVCAVICLQPGTMGGIESQVSQETSTWESPDAVDSRCQEELLPFEAHNGLFLFICLLPSFALIGSETEWRNKETSISSSAAFHLCQRGSKRITS